MRILILASFIPFPPDSGARIRTWEIARRLLGHGHEVTFGLHTRSEGDAERAASLEAQGFQVATGRVNTGWQAARIVAYEIFSGAPPLFALRRSYELEARLKKMHAARPFDVVQVEHFELARYGELLPAPVRAMVLHDLLSVAYERMAGVADSVFWRAWYGYNAARLRVFEGRLLPGFEVCIAVSRREERAVVSLVGAGRVRMLPNCVDSAAKMFLEESGARAGLLFVGLLLYPPNADAAVWMVEEIFPLVRAKSPGCRLSVVGAEAPGNLREVMQGTRGAVLTGWVENLTPYYEDCEVAVVPLRAGGGTRLKILEAMAFGRAVVSTSLGAEGLDVVDGEHLLLADTAEDFARAVVRLLGDRELRDRLRVNARRLVEGQYSWDECARGYEAVYEALSGKAFGQDVAGDG